jgi:hypothetical protein
MAAILSLESLFDKENMSSWPRATGPSAFYGANGRMEPGADVDSEIKAGHPGVSANRPR